MFMKRLKLQFAHIEKRGGSLISFAVKLFTRLIRSMYSKNILDESITLMNNSAPKKNH